MELFSKIFIILITGIFLALFMLLIDHPKRKVIGALIYDFIILLTLVSIPVIALVPLLCPLLILLDVKRLTWQVCLRYLGLVISIISIWALFIIDYLPFYLYPVLVLIYVLIATAVAKNTPFVKRSAKEYH